MSLLMASLVVVKPRAFKAVLRVFVAIAAAIIVAIAGYFFGPIGAVIASVLTSALIAVIFRPPRTTMDAGKVNVRLAEPTRWLASGEVRQGGGVLFAEFDSEGNLWYLVVHCDSILTNLDDCQYYLDDIAVTIDVDRNVLTKDFRLSGSKHDSVDSDGAGDAFVQIWTTTYSETDPVPPRITELDSAFPSKWTSDHKLVGTTFSVVKVKTLKVEDRYKLYHFRGSLGLGEPALSVVGHWSNAFDPRDGDQVNGTPATYLFTRNPVLIWAWFRTHRYGRNKARTEINWDKVAEQATLCDGTVTGISGDHVRYQCGIGVPDDIERIQGEQQILLTMDAQLVFDDDGKCWPRVGAYYVPTLALNRNRDIVAMESQEAQDGESELQGVIVRYTDPDANYTTQPAAPWYNPFYYVDGLSNQFMTVDILECADHNQAMRLAKAIGLRTQPQHRVFPTVGLRGLKARQERIVDLNYDNTFSGDYEIITTVEVDTQGIFCGFGLAPVDADRWDLLDGEEKAKPVTGEGDVATTPDAPTGVVLSYNFGRIEAHFDAPTRNDVTYQFQYIATADIGVTDLWLNMTVQMDGLIAWSPSNIIAGVSYTVRWRAVAAGGLPSAYDDDTVSGTVTILEPTEVTATNGITAGTGATLTWRNPNDLNFYFSNIYRNTVNNFSTSVIILSNYVGGVGQPQSLEDAVAAGGYYYWVVASDITGTLLSTPVVSNNVTVT